MDSVRASNLLNLIGVVPPIRIENGDIGSFIDYLLRCSANPKESVNRNICVLEPYEKLQFQLLSNSVDERTAKKKEWMSRVKPGFYVNVVIEADSTNAESATRFKNEFMHLSQQDILELSYTIVQSITQYNMPSFAPFAIVWHTSQVSPKGEVAPLHAHILFKSVVEPTAEELSFIDS